MAFPSVVGTPVESNATADDATPFTVSRPAGVSGQLTIAVIAVDGNPTLTWPNGYTEFVNVNRAGGFTLRAAYHQEDGNEGTTFDITSDASEKWAAIVYSISGAATVAQQVPESQTVDGGTTAQTTIDPPSLTPTGGAKDYLWIAAGVQDGEEADDDTWANTPPSNFTPSPPRQKSSDIGAAAATNVSLTTAERQYNAASQDPGTFACDASHTWVAATIAVHPSPPLTLTPDPSAAATAIPDPTIQVLTVTTLTPDATATATAITENIRTGTAPTLLYGQRQGFTSGNVHNVIMNAPINAHELYVIVCATPAANAVDTPSGWEKIDETVSGTYRVAVFAKDTDGTEVGNSVDFHTTNSTEMATIGWRMAGWRHATPLAQSVAAAGASGNDAAPDAPNLDPANWGTEWAAWLWIVAAPIGSSVNSPSGWSSTRSQSASTLGISEAHAEVQTASLDPAVGSMTSGQWVAYTIAVCGLIPLTLTPDATVAATAIPSPTIGLAGVTTLAPDAVATATAVPTPSVTHVLSVAPTATAAVTSVPAPTIQIVGLTNLAPSPTAASTTAPDVTVTIWAVQTLTPSPTTTATNAQAVTLQHTKALTPTPPAAATGIPIFDFSAPYPAQGIRRVEVHDPTTHALLEVLDRAYKVSYDLQVNAASIGSFYLPRDDPKWYVIVPFYEVWIYNDLNELIDVFRIAPIQERRASDGTIAQVRLEGYACALQDDIIPAEYIWTNQTVTQVLTDILSYQTTPRITLGTVDASLDKTITTRAAYLNLMRAAWETRNIVGGFISVDADPADPTIRRLNLRESPGQDIGQRIVTGWNLRQISKATESQGIVTKVWALGRGEGVYQQRLSTDKLIGELATFQAHPGTRSTLTFTRDHCRYKGWVIAGAALPDGYETGKDVRIRPMKVWRGASDDTANWEQGASERQLRSKTNDYVPGGGPWTIDYVHADYLQADAQVATYGILANVYVNKNVENSAALHLEAMRYLDTVKSPRISHEVAVADLARIYRDVTFERLHLYDLVNVWDDALDITTKDRIVGVQYGDIDDPNTMKITVSTLALADQTPRSVDVRDRVRKYEQEPDGAITLLGPDSFEDNVDATHPYTRYVEIPTEAVTVISVELRMRTRAYRKYEAGASSSDNSQSSSSSTTGEEAYHNHMVQLSGNNTGPASSSQSGNQNATHNHSDPQGGTTGNEAQNHNHDIYHTHGYNMSSSVTDAGSTHTHGMAHTHQHSHTITLTAGIYEGGTATSIQVLVDGTVASATATTLDDFDLIPYLAKNSDGTIQRGYHTIVFTPNSVGRIQATISGLLFLQSRGAISG